MATISTKSGDLVMVPWNVQGAISNEERLLHSSIKHLDKESETLMKCIDHDQKQVRMKLEKYRKKFGYSRQYGASSAQVTAIEDKRRQSLITAVQFRDHPLMSKALPWKPRTPTQDSPEKKTYEIQAHTFGPSYTGILQNKYRRGQG